MKNEPMDTMELFAMTKAIVVKSLKQDGFLSLADVATLTNSDFRDMTVLIRSGADRKVVVVTEVAREVALIQASGDYVRDVAWTCATFDVLQGIFGSPAAIAQTDALMTSLRTSGGAS